MEEPLCLQHFSLLGETAIVLPYLRSYRCISNCSEPPLAHAKLVEGPRAGKTDGRRVTPRLCEAVIETRLSEDRVSICMRA